MLAQETKESCLSLPQLPWAMLLLLRLRCVHRVHHLHRLLGRSLSTRAVGNRRALVTAVRAVR